MEGYDAKFDPPLDKRLECPICLLAQREPMQTPCGHRFCSACILRALRETGPRCPVDNTRVAVHQLFKDNFAKREVLSLHVHCHAEEHGCDWEGELRNLEVHEKLCDLVTIDCPYECGHVCQRKHLMGHLPSCTNHICLCSTCSISYPQNKMTEHSQFCSKIRVPESVMENISKANEILKWCGHLKMKVHGQNFSATGYLSAKVDTEERFIYSGCWSSSINLIPLMGAASKLFWKTLQGPEVKPVELYFGILSSDSKSNNFQKMLKKKVNAVIGLRLKPSSRRELMIMYIHWSDSQKRLIAYVAELRNYLVREMQSKLQILRRSSQYSEFTQLSDHSHSFSTHSSERGGSSRRGYSRPVRVINVPPTVPAASIENHSHGPPVVPSILSWQLSPSFPAYPWRVQAGGPSVPFFTIPSTPPQFLPAHSYPYTFAPMPAIAAPPFSINPIQPVPAPLTVPSYAGVAVPQVSGLHAELVVSSANSSSLHGPGTFVEGSGNNPSMSQLHSVPAGAVIHPYAHTAQDPALSIPAPSHPVTQVSVVVDPRLNPPAVVPSGGESRREGTQRQNEQGHWLHAPTANRSVDGHLGVVNHMQSSAAGAAANSELMSQPNQSPSESLLHVITSDSRFNSHRRPEQSSASHSNMPGPSGLQQTNNQVPLPSAQSPGSFFSNGGINLETSDDDSDLDSPFWSLASSASSSSSPHHIQYIDPPNDYMSSDSSSPSTRGSGDEGSQSSPSSQQRAIGSALQTLADAAALLSSSPHSDSNTSDDADTVVSSNQSSANSTSIPVTTSSSHIELVEQEPINFSSSTSTVVHPPTFHRSRTQHGGVLAIAPQPQPNVYNSVHPTQLASGYHSASRLEELPVFVPVIHPSVDPLESEAVNPIPSGEGTAVLYAPHDSGVVVTSRPLPMADVPPLIRIAQGQQNVLPEQWPLVEQRAAAAQQIPPPPPPPPAPSGFIRPQPVMAAPPAGGFWEDVMPSLDMRLHETHTSLV